MFKWFRRASDTEPEFTIPDTKYDNTYTPPAVMRHLEVIKQAMLDGNRAEVGNRQRRLAKLGVEVPTKLSHVNDMLEKYRNAS